MGMSYDPWAGWTSVSYSDQLCTGGYGLPTLMVRHDPMDYGTSTPRIEAKYSNPSGYSTSTYSTILSPLDSHYNKASEALGVTDIPLELLHRHLPDTGSQLLPPMQSPLIDVSPLESQWQKSMGGCHRTPAIEDFISRKDVPSPTISRHNHNSNVSHLSERTRVVSHLSELGKVVENVSQSRVRMWNVND